MAGEPGETTADDEDVALLGLGLVLLSDEAPVLDGWLGDTVPGLDEPVDEDSSVVDAEFTVDEGDEEDVEEEFASLADGV